MKASLGNRNWAVRRLEEKTVASREGAEFRRFANEPISVLKLAAWPPRWPVPLTFQPAHALVAWLCLFGARRIASIPYLNRLERTL